jgi:hypothetical protein
VSTVIRYAGYVGSSRLGGFCESMSFNVVTKKKSGGAKSGKCWGHSHSKKNVFPNNGDNLSIATSLYDMLHPSPQIYAIINIPNIRFWFQNEIKFCRQIS